MAINFDLLGMDHVVVWWGRKTFPEYGHREIMAESAGISSNSWNSSPKSLINISQGDNVADDLFFAPD